MYKNGINDLGKIEHNKRIDKMLYILKLDVPRIWGKLAVNDSIVWINKVLGSFSIKIWK